SADGRALSEGVSGGCFIWAPLPKSRALRTRILRRSRAQRTRRRPDLQVSLQLSVDPPVKADSHVRLVDQFRLGVSALCAKESPRSVLRLVHKQSDAVLTARPLRELHRELDQDLFFSRHFALFHCNIWPMAEAVATKAGTSVL